MKRLALASAASIAMVLALVYRFRRKAIAQVMLDMNVPTTAELPAVDKAHWLENEDLKEPAIVDPFVVQQLEQGEDVVLMHVEDDECYMCGVGADYEKGGQAAKHTLCRQNGKVMHFLVRSST